jgi:hypothetical protein
MFESIILLISFAVLTAILPFSATAKSSNGGGGAAKNLSATIQARWPRKTGYSSLLNAVFCTVADDPDWSLLEF